MGACFVTSDLLVDVHVSSLLHVFFCMTCIDGPKQRKLLQMLILIFTQLYEMGSTLKYEVSKMLFF